MTVLLDSNVLIALVVAEHVHHEAAVEWYAASDSAFATCPITQGSVVRFLLRSDYTALVARNVVAAIEAVDRHQFWSDSVSFTGVELNGVIGHRQVTDAYLAQLARENRGELATFDVGLAHLHRDVAILVPSG